MDAFKAFILDPQSNLLTENERTNANKIFSHDCFMTAQFTGILLFTQLACDVYHLPLLSILYVAMHLPDRYAKFSKVFSFRPSIIYKAMPPAYLIGNKLLQYSRQDNAPAFFYVPAFLLFYVLPYPLVRAAFAQEIIGATTPLHRVARTDNKLEFERLLHRGANIHALDSQGRSVHELLLPESKINLPDYSYVETNDPSLQFPKPHKLKVLENLLMQIIDRLAPYLQSYLKSQPKYALQTTIDKLIHGNNISEVESFLKANNLNTYCKHTQHKFYILANSLQMIDTLLKHGVDFRGYMLHLHLQQRLVTPNSEDAQICKTKLAVLNHLLPRFSNEQTVFLDKQVGCPAPVCGIGLDTCSIPVKFDVHDFDLTQLMNWFACSIPEKNALINPITNLPLTMNEVYLNYTAMQQMQKLLKEHSEDSKLNNLKQEQFELINKLAVKQFLPYIYENLQPDINIILIVIIALALVELQIGSHYVADAEQHLLSLALLPVLTLYVCRWIVLSKQEPCYTDLTSYQKKPDTDFFADLKTNLANKPSLVFSYWREALQADPPEKPAVVNNRLRI